MQGVDLHRQDRYLAQEVFTFPVCLETSFTLSARARASAGRVKDDGLEDDGRRRAAGAVCGGGIRR